MSDNESEFSWQIQKHGEREETEIRHYNLVTGQSFQFYQIDQEEQEEARYEKEMAYVWTYGRYQGYTMAEIIKMNPQWVARNIEPDEWCKELVKEIEEWL